MNRSYFFIPIILIFLMFACNEGNDYRDAYVGDYVGSGYTGTIVVEGTGITKYIGSGSGVITVGKDKSDIHLLTITIDNQTFSAYIDESTLTLDPVEFVLTEDSPDYEYDVYQSGEGSITPKVISLNFDYYGTAVHTPDDGGDPIYYDVTGTGSCSGSK